MGFFSRIKEGLKKSSNRLTDGLKKLSDPPPSSPSPSSPPSPQSSPSSPSPEPSESAPEPAPKPTPEPSPFSPPPKPEVEPSLPDGEIKTGEEKESKNRGEGEKEKKVGGWFLAKFGGRTISAEVLQELEELLISADMGAALAGELCRALAADKPQLQSDEDLRRYLAEKITSRLENYGGEKKGGEHGDKKGGEGHGFPAVAEIRAVKERGGVFTIFVMGANGCGKTTSIAKLAHYYSEQGLKVLLVGGDLFRAAGSEQLAVWGERLGIDVMAAEQGGSSSGLVYEAHAKALGESGGEGYDLLIIDTAGRLHNKADLMAELGKLDRVIKKHDAEAPHTVVLVVDGTGGRHILDQAEAFNEVLPLTHVLMTKLDSTAKGGILLALVESLRLPVMAIGVGEGADDLLPFVAHDFAHGLLGLEED